jgi:hypothetical protein
VFIPGPFDLIGGCRRTPNEIVRENDFVCHLLLRYDGHRDNEFAGLFIQTH